MSALKEITILSCFFLPPAVPTKAMVVLDFCCSPVFTSVQSFVCYLIVFTRFVLLSDDVFPCISYHAIVCCKVVLSFVAKSNYG